MTTLYTETFEGAAAGTAITGGSGGNTAFTTVSGTQGWTFSAAHSVSGNSGYYNTGTTTTAGTLSKTLAADQAVVHAEWDFWGSMPTGNTTVAFVINAAANQAGVRLTSAGKFVLLNGTGSALATSTSAYAASSRVHLEWNLSQTAGTQELRIYTGSAIGTSTPTEVLPAAFQTALPINKVNVGLLAGANTNQTGWFDALLVTDTIPAPPPPSTTLYTENFEGDVAGVAITGGSGGNTAFTTVSGTQGWTFDATHRVSGNAGYYNTGTTTTAGILSKTFDADQPIVHAEWDTWNSSPTGNATIASVINGSAGQANVRYRADGHFSVTNAAGTELAASTSAYAALTRVHLEWNLSQSAGTQELRIYTGSAIGTGNPNEAVSAAFQTALPINKVNVGLIANLNTNQQAWVDAVLATTIIPAPLPPSSLLTQENFNTGPTGTAITGGSGGNTAFTTVSGTWTFDVAHRDGSAGFAAKGDTGSTGAFTTLTRTFASATDQYHTVMEYWMQGLPSAATTQIQTVRNGTTTQASVRVLTDGTVTIANGATETARSTVKIPAGTRVHFEWNVNRASSAQYLAMWVGANIGGDTADDVLQGTYTGLTMTGAQRGAVAGGAVGFVFWIDTVYADTTYPPPPVRGPGILDEHFALGNSGDPVTNVNTSMSTITGTITLDSSQSISQPQSAKCDTGSTGAFTSMLKTITSADTVYARWYMMLPVLPPANVTFVSARASATAAANFVVTSTGNVIIQNGGSAVATSTARIKPGVWNRFDWTLDPSTVVQQLEMFLYGNNQGDTANGTLTGAVGGSGIDGFRFGVVAAPPTDFVAYYDDIGLDGATTPAPTGTPQGPLWYKLVGSTWVELGQPVLL